MKYTKEIFFDCTIEGTVAVELGGDLRCDLTQEQQGKLIRFVLDGICPFCLDEISPAEKVCCACLGEIAIYHMNQDACISVA